MPRVLKLLFVLTVLLAVAQAFWHHAHLPMRVASHFDAAGRANDWMSRDAHLGFQAGLALFLGLLFGAIGALPPRLPDSLINLPHREYWLAPQRRAASLAWVGSMAHALGIVVVGFFIFVFQQVYVANVTGALRLELLPLIIGQFVLVAGLITVLLFRFRRPPSDISCCRSRSPSSGRHDWKV
ncbi:MAG: DUF1648 domain-containing protein [Opitutales bacterium]